MRLTKKIKLRTFPSVVKGFTSIRRLFWPSGYYKNRGIADPFMNAEIGRFESFRFIVSGLETPNIDGGVSENMADDEAYAGQEKG